MKIPNLKHRLNESGLSLVEVVASIVIISIILIGFITFFINTAKTTKTSNEVFDATYYAQMEMELLYGMSKNNPINNVEFVITKDGQSQSISEAEKVYYYQKTPNELRTYEKFGNKITDANNIFYYELSWEPMSNNLTKVLVKVFDKKGGILKAQMESAFEWRPSI